MVEEGRFISIVKDGASVVFLILQLALWMPLSKCNTAVVENLFDDFVSARGALP